MFSKTPTGKASKGLVSVVACEGRLRLSVPRTMNGGKQKFVYLGLADTPENRVIAETKVMQANLDIQNNEFDWSLEKYKVSRHLEVAPTKAQTKSDNQVVPLPVLADLWKAYSDFRWESIGAGSRIRYRAIARFIKEHLPDVEINRGRIATIVRNSGVTLDSQRQKIQQFNACCDWAAKSNLIPSNPLAGLNEDFKIRKSDMDEEGDIDPFTSAERDAIIEAFRTNEYCHKCCAKNAQHSNYLGYVKFLFFTGCRPSEAIALQWKDIRKEGVIVFEEAVVYSVDGLIKKKGLKTQKRRRFPVNDQLMEILDAQKALQIAPKPDDYVFRSPRGVFINVGNFASDVWKVVLNGAGIRYRRPYNMRHTYITLQIASGASSSQVAKWCGTSTDVIEKHYLGDISSIRPMTI